MSATVVSAICALSSCCGAIAIGLMAAWPSIPELPMENARR